ncbi:MAG: preprotein translocase subunit SecG, partial [Tepidisphaeraceae bacterium]
GRRSVAEAGKFSDDRALGAQAPGDLLTFLLYLTMTLFLIVCLFMILLVLIQKGRGGGLASAFGGAGGNTAFGSKTGDVLTWATSIVFGVFLVLAVVCNVLFSDMHDRTIKKGAIVQTTATQQPPSTAPGAP